MWEKEREENLKKLGEGIQKARKRKNVSQEELGNQLGIDKSTISRYEDGSIEIPASILPITADILKTDLTALWGENKGFTNDDAISVLEILSEAKYGRKKPSVPFGMDDDREMIPGNMMFSYMKAQTNTSNAKNELRSLLDDRSDIVNILSVGNGMLNEAGDDKTKIKVIAELILNMVYKTDNKVKELVKKF